MNRDPKHLTQELAHSWVWTGGSEMMRTAQSFPFVRDGTPGNEKLVTFWMLLAPIAALKVYGTPEGWERRVEAIQEALATVKVPRSLAHKDPWRAIAEGGRALLDSARFYAQALRKAEATLVKEGWRYNHEKGAVERVGAWNNPPRLRRRLVVAAAEALYPDEPFRNNDLVRGEVSRVLRYWLEPAELDPSRDGPIASDLRNELARRKP